MKHTLSIFALLAAMPAFAQDTRQLDAHEHGVGTLNIAVDGALVAMEFEAPGADIVGFEYAAESDEDRAAIEAALTILNAPLDLFGLTSAAGCSLTSANAALETEGGKDHGDHDHDAHEDHDDHSDDAHEDHDAHEADAGHTEFHASYMFTCETPDALRTIAFTYFDVFENAQEVEVQIIDASGARAFEVSRDQPLLDLDG